MKSTPLVRGLMVSGVLVMTPERYSGQQRVRHDRVRGVIVSGVLDVAASGSKLLSIKLRDRYS